MSNIMKYALVTGGSRGIGRAICTRLAEQGCNILLNYRQNDAEAEKTRHLVESFDVRCELLKFDVSDQEAVERVLRGWLENNPDKHIDILVNNAGLRDDALMIWMTGEQWKNVVNTTLDGFYYVTRVVINPMLQRKYGRVVNVVSISAIKGLPGQTNYSAAKAGIIGATKSLAQEVARRRVTVNAVAPGFIKTDMTEGLNENELSKQIPMRRFGEPDEVAHAVVFLTSEKASYISGAVLTIDGALL